MSSNRKNYLLWMFDIFYEHSQREGETSMWLQVISPILEKFTSSETLTVGAGSLKAFWYCCVLIMSAASESGWAPAGRKGKLRWWINFFLREFIWWKKIERKEESWRKVNNRKINSTENCEKLYITHYFVVLRLKTLLYLKILIGFLDFLQSASALSSGIIAVTI